MGAHAAQEEDNCRFDCLQQVDDPAKFMLVEAGPPGPRRARRPACPVC
jgi:hypothetical protein